MAREFFKCFHDYRRKCEKLSDQEVGRLFRALMEFSETGTAPALAGRESIAFDFIAEDIERDRLVYEQKCKVNAQNGALGGRANATERYRSLPNATEREREEANRSETRKIKDIRDKKEYSDIKGRFKPPTVEEVRAYCTERKNNVDPQAFVDFYESKGWMIGSNKMRDFKAAVRTWERNRTQPKRQNAALKYDQTPISKTDFDALCVNLEEDMI